MNVSVIDVYVINILPRQIVKRIQCLPTNLEAIQKERDSFRDFLFSKYELGRMFLSQLDAWAAYNYQVEMEHLLEEPVLSIIPDKDVSWVSEIEVAIAKKINPANYNEFGGQE